MRSLGGLVHKGRPSHTVIRGVKAATTDRLISTTASFFDPQTTNFCVPAQEGRAEGTSAIDTAFEAGTFHHSDRIAKESFPWWPGAARPSIPAYRRAFLRCGEAIRVVRRRRRISWRVRTWGGIATKIGMGGTKSAATVSGPEAAAF